MMAVVVLRYAVLPGISTAEETEEPRRFASQAYCCRVRAPTGLKVEMAGIEPASTTEILRFLRVQFAVRVTRFRPWGQTP